MPLQKPPCCDDCGEPLVKSTKTKGGAFCMNGHGRIAKAYVPAAWEIAIYKREQYAKTLPIAHSPSDGDRKSRHGKSLRYIGSERRAVTSVRVISKIDDVPSEGNVIARIDSDEIHIREFRPVTLKPKGVKS